MNLMRSLIMFVYQKPHCSHASKCASIFNPEETRIKDVMHMAVMDMAVKLYCEVGYFWHANEYACMHMATMIAGTVVVYGIKSKHLSRPQGVLLRCSS